MEIQLDRIADIALQAGEVIMDVDPARLCRGGKADNSPLTEADRRANEVILRDLSKTDPDILWISEETKATPFPQRASWQRFWLIDPLDGTRGIHQKERRIHREHRLGRRRSPNSGVVDQPVTGTLYTAQRE